MFWRRTKQKMFAAAETLYESILVCGGLKIKKKERKKENCEATREGLGRASGNSNSDIGRIYKIRGWELAAH